jgi:hypothetical protein
MALLTALDIADDVAVWVGLGFTAPDGEVQIDRVRHRLGASGDRITSWSLWGVKLPPGPCRVDGLPTIVVDDPDETGPDPTHPNGVTGLDHLVITTPDHPRTVAALEAIGLTVLRIRETEKVRQAFFRLGPVILELVGGVHATGDGPAAFLGLAWTCADLDATAVYLGSRLHPSKEAVQPGRRIATLDKEAGTRVAMAFMSPPPGG